MIETATTSSSVPQRNLLFGGLALTLRALSALVWTYVLSLGIALLFSLRFYGQWSALLSHSIAAQSLTSAFDLGTLSGGILRLSDHVPGGNPPFFGGAVIFGIAYFLLVPGTLLCYAEGTRAKLSMLLSGGLAFFWRFVRITLLTLLVGAILVGPLAAINTALVSRINEHIVGRPAFLLECVGGLVVFLVASLVRLYFDLVEVYTVQLGLRTRADGRPDRRVRLTLRPAWRTLTRHLGSAWLTFLALAILGALAMTLAARFTVESLAQPRVWPAFLVEQIGILAVLFTRLWQRGAETVLAANHPLPLATSVVRQSGFVPTTGEAPPPSPAYPHVVAPAAYSSRAVSVPAMSPADAAAGPPLGAEPGLLPLDEQDLPRHGAEPPIV